MFICESYQQYFFCSLCIGWMCFCDIKWEISLQMFFF